MSAITIIRATDGRNLTKVREFIDEKWTTVSDFSNPEFFTYTSLPCNDLTELAGILERLRARPDLAIIRGALKPGLEGAQRRRLLDKPDGPATIDATPRPWALLDLDEVPEPPGSPPFTSDPQACMEAFSASLPTPWCDVSFFWVASSGAGTTKSHINAHTWWYFDHAMQDQELKALLPGHLGPHPIDTSLFNAIQIHYTADPILRGAPDPMPLRSGWVRRPHLHVRAPSFSAPPSDKAISKSRKSLKAAQENIRSAKEDMRERRPTMYKMAFREGLHSVLTDQEIESALLQAALVHQLPSDLVLTQIQNGLRDGRGLRGQTLALPWRQDLALDEEGNILPRIDNWREITRAHPTWAHALALNKRSQQIITTRPFLDWPEDTQLPDSASTVARAWFARTLGMNVPEPDARALIHLAAEENAFDPFKDYLSSLEWDGEERLRAAAMMILKTDDHPRNGDLLRWWLISAVARTFHPGAKADHMLILSGPQGYYKTTFFEELAGPGNSVIFADSKDLHNRDVLMKVHGPAIVIVDEMSAFRGKDTEAIKTFLTTSSDAYRSLFGRTVIARPRTCVFGGCTNSAEFLTDATGGRRFWILEPTQPIDIQAVKRHRDQLWAEAVAAYHKGDQWWPTTEESNQLELFSMQEESRHVSTIEDILSRELERTDHHRGQIRDSIPEQFDKHGRLKWVSMAQAANLVGVDPHREQWQVAKALHALHWRKQKRTMIRGQRYRFWEAPADRPAPVIHDDRRTWS